MSRILLAARTTLDGITHEQTIICRQLFAGHVVGPQPMKVGGKIHQMINIIKLLQTVISDYIFTQQSEMLIQKE